MIKPCTFLLSLGFALSALSTPALAADTTYPTRPVRVLVGFTPGGTSDVVARIISRKFTDTWGQQFVVDNRAGAAGMLATEMTARAAPDGHTLIFISSSFSMQPSSTPNLPYEPTRDFAPISLVVTTPYLLVTHPSVDARSMKDLIALAKARPGALSSATAGPGSAIHVTAELFNTMAGVNILLVPYKGVVGITDLIAGQVNMAFAGFAQSIAHIKSGRLKVLGISTNTRSPLMPDVPTIAESAVPGFDVSIWYGLLGPAKIPRPVLAKLHSGVAQALKAPDVRQSLTDLSLDIVGNTPEQFAFVIRTDIDKWMKLAKNTKK